MPLVGPWPWSRLPNLDALRSIRRCEDEAEDFRGSGRRSGQKPVLRHYSVMYECTSRRHTWRVTQYTVCSSAACFRQLVLRRGVGFEVSSVFVWQKGRTPSGLQGFWQSSPPFPVWVDREHYASLWFFSDELHLQWKRCNAEPYVHGPTP